MLCYSNVSEPVEGRATNNTAEIQAITYALELIKRAGGWVISPAMIWCHF